MLQMATSKTAVTVAAPAACAVAEKPQLPPSVRLERSSRHFRKERLRMDIDTFGISAEKQAELKRAQARYAHGWHIWPLG